jgi:hypothetical protein
MKWAIVIKREEKWLSTRSRKGHKTKLLKDIQWRIISTNVGGKG